MFMAKPFMTKPRLALLLAAALTVWAPAHLAVAATASHIQVSRNAVGANQHVEIGLNKSLIIDLPLDAAEVIVSSPNTASAIMRSKRRAIVQGNAVGETNIFFLDGQGARIAVFDVSVTQDASGLESVLARLLPGSNIRVEAISTADGSRIVLSGTAQSSDDIDKAVAIASQYAGAAESVANVISIDGAQQVALKVSVAEVSRETIKQLGINLDASVQVGGLNATLVNEPGLGGASNVVPTGSLAGVGSWGNVSIDATMRVLQRRGALRMLAEPTLTTMSGQEAEFLAGGEYPVPSGVEDGVVSFDFKQFGVNLKFTPTVKSNGVIGLAVDTSVSEPTTDGGYTLNGVTIPATTERTARTSVQLRSGQTLAIAGLIEDTVRQQFNSLPGIGDIPILGALFRSRDFIHSQSELLILVTPVLTQAGGPVALPTDELVFPGDAEAVFLGHMEKLYAVGGGKGGQYAGSVGFVLD